MTGEKRILLPASEMPTHWYNILADLDFDLPPDLPPPGRSDSGTGFTLQVPMELVRQSLSKKRWIEIPAPVREAYLAWRPTPFIRATGLEKALDTPARIYFKYEGDNTSGSHKLNTAIAQAYYYHRSGVKRLVTATGAGQWGTAVAVGCNMFGLGCRVYMVGSSYRAKPYRRTIMGLYGAEVISSPDPRTASGRRFLAEHPEGHGNIALAIAEALDETVERDDTRFCIGSGEPYSILHQTVFGLEARRQMEIAGHYPDIVIGSLGAGSNFGGMTIPFLADNFAGKRAVRCVSVEPTACPKLTRGEYRYDFTDSSGVTPMEKMYTLGHDFATPDIHAGGLRYHATSKLVSALYDRGLVEAVAYPQSHIFESGAAFLRHEGILPAPESAHAVHGAIMEAIAAREAGEARTILFCLSGHGYFDLAAYQSHLDGNITDVTITDAEIAAALARVPVAEPAE
ncbi:MAG: TrpB-like pyridoxal phosphate-dependent enzyme [Hyphomicrobiales bacterium]